MKGETFLNMHACAQIAIIVKDTKQTALLGYFYFECMPEHAEISTLKNIGFTHPVHKPNPQDFITGLVSGH